MKEKAPYTNPLHQSLEDYLQKVANTPGLSEEQLESIYSSCEHLAPIPIPPLPPEPKSRTPYWLAATLLIPLGLLIFFLWQPAHTDGTMQAHILPESIPAKTSAATAPCPETPQARPLHASANTLRPQHAIHTPSPDATALPQHETEPAVSADTLCTHPFILSPENVQFAAITCNCETCDTQYYINNILNDLIS